MRGLDLWSSRDSYRIAVFRDDDLYFVRNELDMRDVRVGLWHGNKNAPGEGGVSLGSRIRFNRWVVIDRITIAVEIYSVLNKGPASDIPEVLAEGSGTI